MSTPKAQRQPMSNNHKMIVIITAIILAAIIAVSVTLIVLLQPKTVTPAPNDPSSTVSSNLPVKNGDFGLISSEDTTYPKSANNWTKYGYKEPSGSSHDFQPIESTNDVVMGIVDTEDEEWNVAKEDLTIENVTLGANPKQHELPNGEKHNNSKVYMIATKAPTNASIMSDSVSVSATTSVKITVWVNTSQLAAGSKATIMIQNSSSTPNAKEENRYAYEYNIEQKDGWQSLEFYVFNRKTSTQYIRVNVGIGNVYEGTNAEGILFIDDISYETVTANDYRLKADKADEGDTTYKIIEKEEETTVPEKTEFLTLKELGAAQAANITYTDSDAYVNQEKFSPFTDKDDFFKAGEGENADRVPTGFGIYKIENNGENKQPVALELTKSISLKLDENDYAKQDYNHVSFWIRTVSKNDNALAYANIVVERKNSEGEWEALDNGDFTAKTEQNIEKDTNNGWSKYDIYLKPAKASTEIRIVIALGSVKGYEGTHYAPDGELHVTTPYFETISSSAYTSASNSTASKKFDLAGSTANTTVSNGSFSSIVANTKQPSNWTPVFAGQNAIYRDGKGDVEISGLSTANSAVSGSGIVNWNEEFASIENYNYPDDDEGRILKLVSNEKSSYGYISNEINTSAHTVYAFSVMAKLGSTEGAATATPYFYLLETNVERGKAVVASVENVYASTTVDGSIFCQADSIYENTGWVRYYIIYVSGDKDTTVRLALFNGSIDGTKPAEAGSTVYYDKASMQVLGTYSMTKDEDNKDATEYIVKFNAANDYSETALKDCENIDEVVTEITKVLGEQSAKNAIDQPTEDEWKEMKKIPEPTEDEEEEEPETPAETNDVNLALLFSILSSVLLLAALAVVIVIKLFKRKKN